MCSNLSSVSLDLHNENKSNSHFLSEYCIHRQKSAMGRFEIQIEMS